MTEEEKTEIEIANEAQTPHLGQRMVLRKNRRAFVPSGSQRKVGTGISTRFYLLGRIENKGLDWVRRDNLIRTEELR